MTQENSAMNNEFTGMELTSTDLSSGVVVTVVDEGALAPETGAVNAEIVLGSPEERVGGRVLGLGDLAEEDMDDLEEIVGDTGILQIASSVDDRIGVSSGKTPVDLNGFYPEWTALPDGVTIDAPAVDGAGNPFGVTIGKPARIDLSGALASEDDYEAPALTKVPNETTITAINESRQMPDNDGFNTDQELFDHLDKKAPAIEVPELVLRPDDPVDLTRLLGVFHGKQVSGDKQPSSNKKKKGKNPPVQQSSVIAVVTTPEVVEKKPLPTNHRQAALNQQSPAPAAEKPKELAFLLQSPEDRELALKAKDSRQDDDIDGIHHLNCNMFYGLTPLGKFLDIYHQAPFTHPQMGRFESVAGFRLFIGSETQNERARTLHSKPAQYATRDADQKPVEGIHKLIANATWMKIIANPDMCRELAACKLVLDSYYLDENQMRGYPKGAARYLQTLDEIRKTLAKSMEDGKSYYPKFDFLERQPRAERRRR